MARPKRVDEAGGCYHALNRGNGRRLLFDDAAAFAAFESMLADGLERFSCELFSYQLMPNHWHLVLRPSENGGMGRLLGWVTLTHSVRLRAREGTVGDGHVYQGRFKSFPVQDDSHFLTVCRYVERNALRAGLVSRAEQWRWGSLFRLCEEPERSPKLRSEWPIPRPQDWVERVNRPLSAKELGAIRRSVNRGRPFGDEGWVNSIARRFHLESTLRTSGRSRKVP